MLEWIRENKRWAQIILFALMLPFACTGIEGYRRMQDDTGIIAKVGDQKITRADFDRAMAEQLERMQQMLGGAVDPKLLDSPQAKQSVLDNLITQRAMLAEVSRERLTISDDQLRSVIATAPAFQDNGTFSQARFQRYLASQNLTGVQFDVQARRDMALQQLVQAPTLSAISSQSVVEGLSTAMGEARVVAAGLVSVAEYAAKVAPDDGAIKTYYEAHQTAYQTQEQVDIEYLELSPSTLLPKMKVSAEDVAHFYEQNKTRYQTAEERRASHILIQVAASASDADKATARKKAEEVLAQVRKAPADFAKLARQYSDDPGSKDRGGDLDFFGRGAMVKPFDEAVFAMKQGEVSGIVQTDFGFHIIQLTGIRPAVAKPLAEVRAAIEAEIGMQLAMAKLSEAIPVFTDTVYEQSDSLAPAAEKIGLEIKTFKGYTRRPPQGNAALASPKLVDAVFGKEALIDKRNTQAIEVAPNSYVAARVIAHRPQAVRPLDDVKNVIIETIKREEGAKLAKAAGEAELAAAKAGKGAVKLGAPKKVTRQAPGELSQEALRAVFRAPRQGLPVWVGVDLGARGYGIYRIDAIEPPAAGDAFTAQTKAIGQSMAKAQADAELDALINATKARTKYEILHPVVAAETKN